ncbi:MULTISPECIES: SDR family NAD(P)-dependent oxidoreductase [Rhizobium/Agrobacterium group]|uniref:SDR family oxidoreductase n=2 Tax=Rhizobium/Agrobacterium group TaxID=227290 RepID=A0A9X3R1R3_9HYPH|nr:MULTISPECIES: SDR family oxidoreductase [Rhizobium/Agrobacterium group]MBO9126221.1 SDR family oxidoreductase [Rhizobium sp. 16-488-2b]MBO9176805.1 SDR family oxidoreductase [Rhizobium sp. 16-488-2a]MBO9197374.1 SDR family oxidoreductase [Rhizobium sp. 16-449-1b]MCZ7466765.1 SDR family oxidoreductase [Rhizobium rhizogenes]MCZ7939205.1 SDR family oxidoreductase [Agrobacterium salinitolerans]
MSQISTDHCRLDGKLAIVTGGGSGIGEATARIFADAGATVVVAGRRMEPLERVAKEIGGHAIACDVSDQEQVKAMFASALKINGRIDVLLNNAGGPGPIASVAEVDMVAWVACMNINLVGAMYCLQEAARIMSAQRSGSIINMSSLMGIQGYPMRSAYVASKFALIGITETMARELGPVNVRVNALMPGAVSGENMDRILKRRAEAESRPIKQIERENYTDVAALRRWVAPEEVGRAALYYASDLSSAITGDKMKVDCGRF